MTTLILDLMFHRAGDPVVSPDAVLAGKTRSLAHHSGTLVAAAESAGGARTQGAATNTAAFFAGFIEVRYNLVGRKYVGSVIIEKTSSRFFEPGPGRTGLVGAGGTYTFSKSRPNRCPVLRRIDTTALRFRFTGSLGRGCLHSWLSGGLSVS